MSMRSLLHHFEAPEHYMGNFGWLCGYSADCVFLDQAAERFTRQTNAQRAYQGQISLALMLDPAHAAIKLSDAPGVAHLLFKTEKKKPFALLHAKVAILGFRHEKNPEQWRVRLLVSTGNWTIQTLTESIDLFACIECSSEDMEQNPSWLEQNCSDINAAWKMLKWLSNFFDTRILSAHLGPQKISLTALSIQWLENCLNSVAGCFNAKTTSRFFDNRKKSLLTQLVPLINLHGSSVKRNYLGMGSGFFESSNAEGQLPSVLSMITSTLQEANLLTARPEIDIFVNPAACQAVAKGFSALYAAGYCVRAAEANSELFGNTPRFLHAKFIFSANFRDYASRCSSFWVYLGSGNLTGPGFAKPMSASVGNLEAGIVLSPEKDITRKADIADFLPVQFDSEFSEFKELSQGLPMQLLDDGPTAPPIAWLCWQVIDNECFLYSPEQIEQTIILLSPDGAECESPKRGLWRWISQEPKEVTIQWTTAGQVQSSILPVLDELGRLAASPLPELNLDEILWQLASFPCLDMYEDMSLEPSEYSVGNSSKPSPKATTEVGATVYPIRRMMDLVEQIASKQIEIHRQDWLLWCTRLEQSLLQVANDSVIKVFKELHLNPLSPLYEAAFLPEYAEQASSPEGANYRDMLARIEVTWGVIGLRKIGSL